MRTLSILTALVLAGTVPAAPAEETSAPAAAPLKLPYVYTKWKQFTEKDGLPDGHVFAVKADGPRVWVGTEGGLALIDKTTGKVTKVWREADGLPFRVVTAIDVDTETGDVWLGLFGGGLARLSGGRFDGRDHQVTRVPHGEEVSEPALGSGSDEGGTDGECPFRERKSAERRPAIRGAGDLAGHRIDRREEFPAQAHLRPPGGEAVEPERPRIDGDGHRSSPGVHRHRGGHAGEDHRGDEEDDPQHDAHPSRGREPRTKKRSSRAPRYF